MSVDTLPPPPPPSPPVGPAGSPGRPPVSHRARTAWKAAASLAAVAVLLWGGSQAVTQIAHEERTEVTTYDAAGLTTLDVGIDSGSLTVVGTDSDTITVTARISDGLRPTTVRREVDGDRLELHGGCFAFFSSFCNVAFTVEVPSTMSVRARLGDDDIRLSNVDGQIDVHTDNGTVTVRGATGDLVLGSDNGSVNAVDLRSSSVEATSENGDVSLAFVDAPTTVRATSDNGDVTVEVPDDGTAYAVSTGSAEGSTAAPIRTDPDAGRSITARSDNGDVQITYATR